MEDKIHPDKKKGFFARIFGWDIISLLFV
jgi:hypothetical protein